MVPVSGELIGWTALDEALVLAANDDVAAGLLIQRIQQLLPGRGAGKGSPLEQRAAKAPLIAETLRRAVERQAHLLQVEDRVDGLLAHDLGRVLVDEVVATLDGVEGVPLPVVLFNIGQCGAHATLGRAGV